MPPLQLSGSRPVVSDAGEEYGVGARVMMAWVGRLFKERSPVRGGSDDDLGGYGDALPGIDGL